MQVKIDSRYNRGKQEKELRDYTFKVIRKPKIKPVETLLFEKHTNYKMTIEYFKTLAQQRYTKLDNYSQEEITNKLEQHG